MFNIIIQYLISTIAIYIFNNIALPLARKHLPSQAYDYLLPLVMGVPNMIRGVPTEIPILKGELQRIEDLINKEDRMADDGKDEKICHAIKAKIKEHIEISFHIEDIIDEYNMIHEQQQLAGSGYAAAGANFIKTMFPLILIAYKIRNIKSRICEINYTSEEDHGNQIQSCSESSSSSATTINASELQYIRDAPLRDESEVVGFEESRNKLIKLLVKGRAERMVVFVVGRPGLGKTTLAKKVFDHQKVVKHFNCHVWITVSRPYDIEKLLKDMLQKFYIQQKKDPQSLDKMDRKSLVDEVRNNMKEKRYVVVFDDVWDPQFWYDIEFAMIDNKKGSRILITTRYMNVLDVCQKSSLVARHILEPLTKKKSLQLFKKMAFRNIHGGCPENLKDISSKIVEKCNGLPLAIVVAAGLLSSKVEKTFEWNNFYTNINQELKGNYTITRIIGLSYHDLPYNLKSCLLYFGLHPEDYEVPSKILTRLWVAEGFVKEDGRTLEAIAEGYLYDLISRNLVQVVSSSIDGRVKSCCVHDQVHAMILIKYEYLSFCKNITEGKQLSLTGKIRRLSITTSSDNLMKGIENSHVRTLLASTPKALTESFVRRIPTKYKQLKVLLLKAVEVPKNLGSLIHLKYFMFSRNIILLEATPAIPKSIGMLKNLETLNLYNRFTAMPKEICKLKKLRHFIGYKMCLIELKDGIGGMTSLETLRSVDIGDGEGVKKLIQELKKLTRLRELGLENVMGKYMNDISSSINKMQELEKLNIDNGIQSGDFVMDLNSPPPKLRSLSLIGPFDELPNWISKLQNLVTLKFKLKCSKKMGDVLNLLKSKPSLLSLTVFADDDDDEDEEEEEEEVHGLHFQVGWFKNLKELDLSRLSKLSYVIIDPLALKSLKKLTLYKIPQLKTLPTGIQHLKLEVLVIMDMSEEFIQSIAPVEGKEHEIFKKVPFVRCL